MQKMLRKNAVWIDEEERIIIKIVRNKADNFPDLVQTNIMNLRNFLKELKKQAK